MIATLKKIVAAKAARENNEGFTLIELLIVIVVLGILAGVVVFSLGSVTTSSAVAACQASGTTISTAIQAALAENSGVTITQNNLLDSSLTGGPFLQSWPNSTHYAFSISAGGALTLAGKGTTGTTQTWAGSATCNSTAGIAQTVI